MFIPIPMLFNLGMISNTYRCSLIDYIDGISGRPCLSIDATGKCLVVRCFAGFVMFCMIMAVSLCLPSLMESI